jgi:hypothetical protein
MPQTAQYEHGGSAGYGTLAAAAAGFYGLGLLALAAPYVVPEFRWDGDIISRAVLLAYPKGRETVLYLLACVLIPALTFVTVRVWRRMPSRIPPRLDALTHLPLAAWAGFLVTGRGLLWAWLLGALLFHLLLRAVLLLTGPRQSEAAMPESSVAPPTLHLTDENIRARHAFTTAWARVLLAGAACGLTLFPRFLAAMDPKFAAWCRTLLGMTLLCLLWIILSALPLPRLGKTPARRATALSSAFLPLTLLLLRHFRPGDRTYFHLLATAAGIASVAWLGLLLLRRRGREKPETPPAGMRSKTFWWVVVPLAIYAIGYIHETAGQVDLYHEGERIVPPMATTRGAVPYRDVFLWHGLFENDLKGRLAFGLVEESVAGMRRFEAILEPLSALAFLLLAQACLGSPLGGLAAALLLMHWVAPPNVRYLLPYLAFALLAVWLRRRAEGFAGPAAAGALASLAVFHSLDGGMGALASAILILGYGVVRYPEGRLDRQAVRAAKQAGAFLGGVLAGALVPLTWLTTQGALIPFFQVSGEIVFGLSDRSSHPYATLMPVVGQPEKLLVTYLPALLILWGLGHLAARSTASGMRRVMPTLIVPLAGALVFYRAVIRRPDMDHVIKVTPLIFLVLLMLMLHHAASLVAAGSRPSRRVMALIALLPLCGLFVLLGVYQRETAPGQSIQALKREPPLISGPDEPMRQLRLNRAGYGVAAREHSARWIEGVAGFLHQNLSPGEPFYDFTNKGLFHFLADRPCPTRYVQTTYAASRAAQQEVVADLAQQRPRYVTFPSGNMRKYDYDRILHPVRHPLITRFLYRQYRPFTVIGDTILLVRQGEPGHPRTAELDVFLEHESFDSDLGQLPRLLAQTAVSHATVRDWEAAGIANQWRRFGPVRAASRVEGNSFHFTTGDRATQPRLTSPPLALQPADADALILRLSADEDLEVVVYYRPEIDDQFTNRARLAFNITGDGQVRDYRVDLGLMPNWAWRGQLDSIQVRIHENTGPLRIERIKLVKFAAE